MVVSLFVIDVSVERNSITVERACVGTEMRTMPGILNKPPSQLFPLSIFYLSQIEQVEYKSGLPKQTRKVMAVIDFDPLVLTDTGSHFHCSRQLPRM